MKNETPTIHNEAKKSDFAKIVIMSGDPLRSKYIAENFLENAKLVNNVRGIQGYTGTYKGKKISVMAHGMGMPSMYIYAYELFKFYDVNTIIRVGTCGGLTPNVHVNNIIIGKTALSCSDIGKRIGYYAEEIDADQSLQKLATITAKELNIDVISTKIITIDVFDLYTDMDLSPYIKKGCTVAEMEAYALYSTARSLNKNALTLLTCSDNGALNEHASSQERQTSLNEMITIALETAIKIKG